jgi:hypothetical protein
LSQRFTSESDLKDDIYGEYPFILYKHYFITRANIPKFCKMMTGINGADRVFLNKETRERMDTLEMLIIHRLHIVTVTILANVNRNLTTT